ncbi:uncharacterized protein LOC135193452 [Vanessa tameamea]|uniref:Uncharacterized protein LOC135193452 n=1 Tax=Vanessa tameamea TaxID=334116 RepID=A0ABM4AL71_VANTA
MIAYLAKIINLFVSLIQNIILFASSIGQVIVVLITIVISFLCNIVRNILIFFQIVYEDNIIIFTDDLPNLASNLNEAIYYQWSNLQNILSTFSNETTFKVNMIISNIKMTLSSTIFIIGEVLHILKCSVVFCGDTLWLVLTFVPVQLPYLIKIFFKYLKDTIVNNVIDGYLALLKITNFLSDVPLQSFMGIVTAMIIVRLCIHFREVIHSQILSFYWTLIRKVTYIYYVLYNYCTNSEVRIITQMVDGGQPVVSRNSDVHLLNDNDEDPANSTDALCVICQERQKCVLTLPCRHVCLCTECCMRLYGYQRTCPICRTFIYHSVTVYL